MFKVDYRYRMGGKEYATQQYIRNENNSILSFQIEDGNTKIDLELSVNEAESLANELMEYLNDIKEYADVLKSLKEGESE